VTALATWGFTGREHTPLTVTSATMALQGLLHTVFSFAHPAAHAPAAPALPATGHGPAGHAGHAGRLADAQAAAGSSPSFGMLAAHLLAALLLGLWLAHGERAVFRLLRTASLALFRPLCLLLAAVVRATPEPPGLRPRRTGDRCAPPSLLPVRSLVSRGPPRVPAVL
jgi:hypothetical protein